MLHTRHSVLHQLLGLEETLEVSHLPGAHDEEDGGLRQGPPQHPLVGALAGLAEPLLAVALVVLLLRDLLHLVQQLPHAQLQLRQLLLLGHVGVVDGVLTHLDVEVDSQLGPTENILCRSKVYLWV